MYFTICYASTCHDDSSEGHQFIISQLTSGNNFASFLYFFYFFFAFGIFNPCHVLVTASWLTLIFLRHSKFRFRSKGFISPTSNIFFIRVWRFCLSNQLFKLLRSTRQHWTPLRWGYIIKGRVSCSIKHVLWESQPGHYILLIQSCSTTSKTSESNNRQQIVF